MTGIVPGHARPERVVARVAETWKLLPEAGLIHARRDLSALTEVVPGHGRLELVVARVAEMWKLVTEAVLIQCLRCIHLRRVKRRGELVVARGAESMSVTLMCEEFPTRWLGTLKG